MDASCLIISSGWLKVARDQCIANYQIWWIAIPLIKMEFQIGLGTFIIQLILTYNLFCHERYI